ncbi:MAG: alkaline shock response membrane anchor protein AmaP [bacterium]
MRVFNRIVIIMNTLFFLLFGIVGIIVSLNLIPEKNAAAFATQFITYMSGAAPARVFLMSISVFLIFTALFTIIGNIETRRLERTVVLQSQLGDILVSLPAIEDFSKIIKSQVDGVKEIRGKVYARRKRMDVRAKVVLYSDRPVADVSQEIQEAIINYIQYTLGITAEVRPVITVTKVVFKSKDEK